MLSWDCPQALRAASEKDQGRSAYDGCGDSDSQVRDHSIWQIGPLIVATTGVSRCRDG